LIEEENPRWVDLIPAYQLDIEVTSKINAVIPGRREAASPESITTIVSELRVRAESPE